MASIFSEGWNVSHNPDYFGDNSWDNLREKFWDNFVNIFRFNFADDLVYILVDNFSDNLGDILVYILVDDLEDNFRENFWPMLSLITGIVKKRHHLSWK